MKLPVFFIGWLFFLLCIPAPELYAQETQKNRAVPRSAVEAVDFTNINAPRILVVLYDVIGREVYSKVILNHEQGIPVAIDPVEKLKPGVYLVMGSNSNKINFRQKLVIKANTFS